ncbi:MAG: hypothetical protein ABIK89_05925, partial [Planctomycetota bacterium]
GGEVAEDVLATLTLPDGVRSVGQPQQKIDNLTHWLPKSASWQIEAARVGLAEVGVKIEAPGVEPALSTAAIPFTPAPQVPQGAYIPEPKPIKSEYDVGAFYFPGWPT